MNFTRVIVAALVASVLGTVSVQAQTLRSDSAIAPAEFPPASFTGKQYVDSTGCIFIRAGIDGNVTWVPRVTRGRKQVCGYTPTFAPGTTTVDAAPASKPSVVEITVPPSGRPDAGEVAEPVTAEAQPQSQPQPKPLPQAVAQTPAAAATPATPPVAAPAASPAAKPRVATAARPAAAAPVKPAAVRRPSPGPAPTVFNPSRQAQPEPIAPRATAQQGEGCANASTFSQNYINRGPGVRCGPQQEAPVNSGAGRSQKSALTSYDPNARSVPRHVYENRRNTQNVSVPKGYRPVWSDDRLNPHRAEQGLAPAAPSRTVTVPKGYRRVERDDDRLNPNRGMRTAAGEAQSDLIWSRTVPRKLVRLPVDRSVATVPANVTVSRAATTDAPVLHFSTRSEP